MYRLNALIIFVLSILYSMNYAFSAPDSTNYFPLKVGNTWSYKSYGGFSHGSTFKHVIEDSILINDKTYYHYNYSYVRKDDIGRVYRHRGSYDELWLDFSLTSGHYEIPYNVPNDSLNEHINVSVGSGNTVETPLDTFYNCKSFAFNDHHIDGEEATYYYAPNIGLVFITRLYGYDYITGYKFPTDSVTVDVLCSDGFKNEVSTSLAIFPNPSNSYAIIHFSLSTTSPIKLQVINILGEVLDIILDEVRSKGSYRIAYNTNTLISGTYFIVLKTATEIKKSKISVLK